MSGIFLKAGAHTSLEQGGCVMEFSAWVAGEPHSDEPHCVSPVIGAFMRSWNDALDDETRQLLIPYAIKCVGTNTGPEDDKTRAWMACDWLVRVQTPAWLRLAGLIEEARALESLARIVDAVTCRAAQPALEVSRRRSDAARDGAGDAAGARGERGAWGAGGGLDGEAG